MNHQSGRKKQIALGVSLGLATIVGGVGPAQSQELKYNPSVYVAPEVGYFNPDNRFGTDKKGPDFGLKVGKAINQWFDFQVGGSYARVRDGADGDRYQQSTIGVDGRVFADRDRIRPFLELGVGAENDRRNLPNHANSRTSPYASAGVGVQYVISDQWAAEAEYKKVFGFQRSDAFGFRRDENNYATVGLTYYFDKSPSPAPRVEPPAPAPIARVTPPPPPPPAPRFEKQTMSSTELFDFDRAVVKLPQPKLDEIAQALQANPGITNVRITGYTDRIGPKPYNLKLSQRRADAVKAYLVGKGIDGSRLTTIGKGEADPVVQCTEKNRAALIKCLEPNRRVEVEEITIEKRVQ